MSMNKDKLLIQKLSNELSHYKTLLREMATKKEEAEQKQINQAEELEKQKGLIEEKNKHLSSIKLELKAQQEELETKELENHSERHKLKMKIDYLTNKCFQLNCKLDKKDYSEVPKPPVKDSAILLDIIENKKKEYSTDGQIQDPADFLFNIFAQYESLSKNVKMLSEENDLLKNQLAEAKVKYADSAGQKEKLGIEMKSIQNQIQRLSTHSSQRGSQTSTGSQNEDSQESIRGERKVGTISSYLGGISFWRKNQ